MKTDRSNSFKLKQCPSVSHFPQTALRSSKHQMLIKWPMTYTSVSRSFILRSITERSFNQRNAAILHGINLDDQGAGIFDTLAKSLNFTIAFIKILPDKEFMTISAV